MDGGNSTTKCREKERQMSYHGYCKQANSWLNSSQLYHTIAACIYHIEELQCLEYKQCHQASSHQQQYTRMHNKRGLNTKFEDYTIYLPQYICLAK